MRAPTQAESPAARELLDALAGGHDFPALSQVIAQVNRIVEADDTHASNLTDAILKDVALTNRLLRFVNSAQFGGFGSQPVSTVSRAVVILGYDAVRDLALSLMLFEHLSNHAQADELKADAMDSFLCGVIGRMLARRLGQRDGEELFICALFRNLGRLLTRLHFYERSQRADALMAEQGLDEAAAARQVFGLSYDEIGQAVGRHWHLPNRLLDGMAPLPAGPVRAPANPGERLRVLANLARDLYQTLRDAPEARWDDAVAAVARDYREAVALPGNEVMELLRQAGETAEKDAPLFSTSAQASPLLRRMLAQREQAAAQAARADTEPLPEAGLETAAAADAPPDANGVLIDGLQELTGMLLEGARASDLFEVLAELLFRCGAFDNVLICALDPAGKQLAARIGHGPDAARLRAALRIPLTFAPDVFHAATAKGVDLLISDTGADNIRDRIPAWYRPVLAKSFLLLPLTLNQRGVALIYADKRDATMRLSHQTLGLLKSLRNQTVLALRQNQKP